MPIEELEFRVYELDLELELGPGMELPDRRTGQNVLKYAQTAKQPNSHSHGFSSGLLVWFKVMALTLIPILQLHIPDRLRLRLLQRLSAAAATTTAYE